MRPTTAKQDMLQIRILAVGKTKERWLEEALGEYVKRLRSQASFDFCWYRDDKTLQAALKTSERAIALDPTGELLTSCKFATLLNEEIVQGGARLTFIIGGPDGLPLAVKAGFRKISLSPLTFTHQITRLVLMEQIYRGLEILKGSKYHRA